MSNTFSLEHAEQFVNLWCQLANVELDEDTEDAIAWTLTASGQYSVASAYKAQFLGATSTNMNRMVWKIWAPPKVKFFAWLAIQNRFWTADRLAKRGWPNCGLCPLCKRAPESITHLLVHCRYTTRLWCYIRDSEWLGLHALNF